MPTLEQADSWIGRTAVDNTGEQIGMVTQIWVDDATTQPAWASLRVSGSKREALVPLAGAAPLIGGLQLAYSKGQIIDAPPISQDGNLAPDDTERVDAYYAAPETGQPMVATPPSWADLASTPHQPADDQFPVSLQAGNGPTPAPKQGRRFGRKRAPAEA